LIRGVEASAMWSPLEHWSFNLSGEKLQTRFYRIDAQSSSYSPGDPLDFFPKYSVSGSVQYSRTFDTKPVYARIDYSQRGRETQRNRSSGPFVFYESDVIQMLNASAGVSLNDRLQLELFAQNLLDDRGLASAANINPTASRGLVGVRSQPRSFGVQFSMNFY
jgi:outer membrane receptor protein involved in Fe transport